MEYVQFCCYFPLLTPPHASYWTAGIQTQSHTCNSEKKDVGPVIPQVHREFRWRGENAVRGMHTESSPSLRGQARPPWGSDFQAEIYRMKSIFQDKDGFRQRWAADAKDPSNGEHGAFQKLKGTSMVEPGKGQGSSAWIQAGDIDMEIWRKKGSLREMSFLFLNEAF